MSQTADNLPLNTRKLVTPPILSSAPLLFRFERRSKPERRHLEGGSLRGRHVLHLRSDLRQRNAQRGAHSSHRAARVQAGRSSSRGPNTQLSGEIFTWNLLIRMLELDDSDPFVLEQQSLFLFFASLAARPSRRRRSRATHCCISASSSKTTCVAW